MDVRDLAAPVIAAPMACGPSLPGLVAAVGRAGGLGFLAAGYKTPEAVRTEIHEVKALSDAPFGVNIFWPVRGAALDVDIAEYTDQLSTEAARQRVGLGLPFGDDDHLAEKVELVRQEGVPVVSFVFGLPSGEVVDALHEAGVTVLVTVTTPSEALAAEAVGADAVIAQGVEAGGHRGGFTDVCGIGEYGLLALLRLITRTCRLPVIGAGGVADGAALAAVLAAGAVAAQIGTAFLSCPEAGTDRLHRAVLGTSRQTMFTRAFTGRRGRSIVNGFMNRHPLVSTPAAYPQVDHLTLPLRAAALAAGDAEGVALWAGQTHSLTEPYPAEHLVRRLCVEARAALAAAGAIASGI
ncbi:nitronate monooxygenase [Phytohabitans sp. LJ34]|uniref:nitronate monooxygenase n=1 Tax=Phytohabitans sp. LJ34 TaxID=3452217 RepID=UPI003F8A2DD4